MLNDLDAMIAERARMQVRVALELGEFNEWIAAARKRIHKQIDIAAQVAKGRPLSTATRSVGQLYRAREPKGQ